MIFRIVENTGVSTTIRIKRSVTRLNETADKSEHTDIESIVDRFKRAWSEDTAHPSYKGKWGKDNPTAGQCAVTALVLNDLYGWDIYDVIVGRARHFFNKTDSGEIIDITAEQFGNTKIPYGTARTRDRNDLLKSPDVKQRYKLLLNNLDNKTSEPVKEDYVRIVEESELPADYGTGEVSGDSIWDNRTHTPFYDALITDPEHMAEEENLKGEIVMMSPKEYFDECATKIFNTDVNKLINSRKVDKDATDYISKLITEHKRRVFMPWINYAQQGQEGLHRMYVAAQLFGWDHKFPVLSVTWANEDRARKSEEDKKQREFDRKINKAIDSALRYEYEESTVISELKEQMLWELGRLFDDISFSIEIATTDYGYLFTINGKEYNVDSDEVTVVTKKDDDTEIDFNVKSDEELDDLKNLSPEDYIKKWLS